MEEKFEREINNEIVEIVTERDPLIERVNIIQLENELNNLNNSIKAFESRIKECEEQKQRLLQKIEIVKEKAKKQVKKKLNEI